MARIICDNTQGLNKIQTFAFKASNPTGNPEVLCQDTSFGKLKIPKLEITPFNGVVSMQKMGKFFSWMKFYMCMCQQLSNVKEDEV